MQRAYYIVMQVYNVFSILLEPMKVLLAARPPLGLPRAVASRRRKKGEPDWDSAQQPRARDRTQQVLMSSQKTRQAPPLLHLYSPWWAQEVSELLIWFYLNITQSPPRYR